MAKFLKNIFAKKATMEENKDANTETTNAELKNENSASIEDQTSTENTEVKPDLTTELQNKVNELNDKYLRLFAEMDNLKRRTAKERIELQQTAGKEIFVALLPVLDDFERAFKSIESAKDIEAIKEGLNLIHNKMKSTLQSKGLESFDSKGLEFNSDIHEAITNIPAPSKDLVGKVVDEVEKGYSLNGSVIRYAKVIVGV